MWSAKTNSDTNNYLIDGQESDFNLAG